MINLIEKAARNYCQTILEIIEDKPSYKLPLFIYNILIMIYYFQIGGYFFSTGESKPLIDGKFNFIARVNEISTGSYLLYTKGNDDVSLKIIKNFNNNIII